MAISALVIHLGNPLHLRERCALTPVAGVTDAILPRSSCIPSQEKTKHFLISGYQVVYQGCHSVGVCLQEVCPSLSQQCIRVGRSTKGKCHPSINNLYNLSTPKPRQRSLKNVAVGVICLGFHEPKRVKITFK